MDIPGSYRDQVLEMDAPAWVVTHATKPPPATTPDGANYPDLLHDVQHNLETATLYRRSVYYLPNHAAVTHGSRIEIHFSPTSERVIFHTLQIFRGGHVIDLRLHQEVRVLHREAQMERFVFDGRLLVVLVLNGIEAGDVVDYSYSIEATKPPLFGHVHGQFLLQARFSAEAVRCRLLYREGRIVYVAPRRCDLQPQVGFTPDGLVECLWERDDVRPLRLEPDMPAWASPFHWIDYGEFSTWADVAEAASRLFYRAPEDFPDYLVPWLEQVRASSASPEHFVLQLVRYVQERIRYVSVSVDEHSCTPYDLPTILERSYGDCKDKAILLSELLRKAGFDAAPALVHSVRRELAIEGLARPNAFDHAIVRLNHEGRTHWIDATLTDQGGRLETLSCPPYGVALVLNSPGEPLVTVGPAPELPTVHYDEFAKVHKADGMAEMRVTRLFSGAAADEMRRRLTVSGLAQIDRDTVADYQRAFPDVSIQTPTVCQDDRDGNRLQIVHTLLLQRIWQWSNDARDPRRRINRASFPVFGIFPVLRPPPAGKRLFPYSILHPFHLQASLEVRLPAGFRPDRKQGNFMTPSFQCKYTKDVTGNSGRVVFQYVSKSDHVKPKDLANYASELRQIEELARFNVDAPQGVISSGSGIRRPQR